MYLLFQNKESLKFNDFFEVKMFHLGLSAKAVHFSALNSTDCQGGAKDTSLCKGVFGSQTQPYVYCGELEYHSYDSKRPTLCT